MGNFTSMTNFLLLQFSEVRELQILHFFVFLALYLTTITGNFLIIAAVTLDNRLHTPMYFFLMNLAIMDLGIASDVTPKSMVNSYMNSRSISYSGCVAQVLCFIFFETSDICLLTIMAHDRYIAICNPLRYEMIMHKGACIHMVVIAWFTSLLYATLHTGSTFSMAFCSNSINQFFCEVPQLLKLACSDSYLIEIGLLAFGCGIGAGCFIFIIMTYVQIFATVLRIPSVQGQKKALSTCLPHLAVVSLLLFTSAFAYAKPPSDASSELDIIFAVIYAIIPPMLNPFIYSMRNQDIKTALCKLLDLGHSSTIIAMDIRKIKEIKEFKS